MLETILPLLTDGSPFVAFAGYLIWSNQRQEKRLFEVHDTFVHKVEKMVADGKIEMDQLRGQYQQREDELRDRWHDVVKKVESDKDHLERQILDNVLANTKVTEESKKAIELIATSLGKIKGTLDRVLDRIATTKGDL